MTTSFNPAAVSASVLDISRADDVLARFDAACLVDGQLQVMPAAFYAEQAPNDLALWCFARGFYCLPTVELVEQVRELIDTDDAVEIGSGNGVLGRALGIPRTDSRMQERVDVATVYADAGQPTVEYGADVEKLTALEAVEKYRPRVVVAAWVTHRYKRERHALGGNMNGVDEGKLLEKPFVRRYVFVGHERVHANKPILARRHETFHMPGRLYSRTLDRRDVTWVWEPSKR